MSPGEVKVAAGEIVLNAKRKTLSVQVTNTLIGAQRTSRFRRLMETNA